jgi:hypothetical protein
VYSDARTMTHKGWKEEGIRRFNAICHKVKQDRMEHPQVLTALVRTWKEGMHRTTRPESEDVITGCEVYHDLWEDDSEHAAAV